MRREIILILIVALCFLGFTQDTPKAENVKSWAMPDYMVENLRNMIEKFNKDFTDKMDSYKAELRKRFEEFKDLPEDVVFDIETGRFFKRSDYVRLQQKALDEARKKIKNEEVK